MLIKFNIKQSYCVLDSREYGIVVVVEVVINRVAEAAAAVSLFSPIYLDGSKNTL